MKKVLALALAISFAGSAFALDVGNGLAITGSVKTGVRVEGSSQEGNPDYEGGGKGGAQIYPWNDDAGHSFRTEATFTYKNGGSGFTTRLRAQQQNGGFNNATPNSNGFQLIVPFAYGYTDLLGNGLLELSGGILDNGKWRTMDGFDLDTQLENDNLVKFEVKPIDGLSLGFSTFIDWPKEAGSGKLTGLDGDENPFSTTVVGAGYTTDLFQVTVSGRLNKKDSTAYYATKAAKSYEYKDLGLEGGDGLKLEEAKYFEILGFAKVSAIKILPIFFDIRFNTLSGDTIPSSASKPASLSTLQTAVKPVFIVNDALSGALRIRFKDANYKIDGKGAGFWDLEFRPSVEYKVNSKITGALEAGFELAQNVYGIDDDDSYKDWKGGFNLEIKPKLTFDFGNGAKIMTFYDFLSKTEGYMDTTGATKPKPLVAHTITLDLIWSF
jgi:hypothetical protein